jgi:hypothetical protein
VKRGRSPERLRSRSRPGALLVALLLGCVAAVTPAAPLPAQAPDTLRPMQDTVPLPPQPVPVPADTVEAVPNDTVPPPAVPRAGLPPGAVVTDTVPEEAPPPAPPSLPPLPPAGPVGWATGVWEWNRQDLLRLADLSLLHLLERIPGITPVRITSVGQAEAASVFGSTAAAIRYEVDGFVLDPLIAPTFDPSRFALSALESVRVERRVTGATVRIRTAAPVEPSAYSLVEAGTGDYRTNLFRGTFMAPGVLGGALALGFESLGSQVLQGGSSALLGGWLKWTWSRDDSGIQLEFRQSDMTRGGAHAPLDGSRQDWVVRARSRIGPIVAEGYAGATAVEDYVGDIVVREGSPQGGVRLRSDLAGPIPMEATAAVRLRSHPRLPSQDLEVAAWAYPAPWLAVGGEADHARWSEGDPTGRAGVTVRAGPLVGLTATAGLFRAAERLAEVDVLSPGPGPGLQVAREGARAGVEFRRGTLRIGAAAVRASADPATGFGLPYDTALHAVPAMEATGIEAVAHIPTLWGPLWFEGTYVGMGVPAGWPYFPSEQWSAALVYHHLPLPSGNLEIFARAEHALRTRMAAPATGGWTAVGAYRANNLELTIRVMTVRAFLRWQNFTNRPLQQDIPGFQRPGQHVLYGVKWEFWN